MTPYYEVTLIPIFHRILWKIIREMGPWRLSS